MLMREVRQLSHEYVRKGGKQNRRKQAKRMLAFTAFVRELPNPPRNIAEIGKKQVGKYWQAHRELSDAVLYQHWLALRELWQLSGKQSEPPKPRKRHDVVNESQDSE